MAFDSCPKRKLYSDLFKCCVENKEEENMMVMSTTSSSSPCGSSSSGFSTPFYSDYESSDGDFIAELTRQMAECMLQDDDDDDEKVKNCVSEDSHVISDSVKNKEEQSYVDYGGSIHNHLKNSVPPTFQVNELKNQVSRERHISRGRRAKRSESAQQQHYRQQQYRGRNGSGMQAVFLGGSGSRSGPPGTGVFMPRINGDPNNLKKKSGCSIVLMPTRVLQTLELHFKQRHHSTTVPSLSSSGGTTSATLVNYCPKPKGANETTVINGHSQLEKRKGLGNREEMQLPPEWTY